MNFAPKRATVERRSPSSRRATPATRQFGGNIDFGRRFGPDDSVGLRAQCGVHGRRHRGLQPQRHAAQPDGRASTSAATNTRIDADIGYTNRNITGTQGGTFLGAGLQLPAAPSAQNNYYPPWRASSSPTNLRHAALRARLHPRHHGLR